MHTYILRTSRGRDIMAFDNETRAREEMNRHAKRIGIELQLIRVLRVEERVA